MPTTVFSSMSVTLGSLAKSESCDLLSRAPKPLIAAVTVPSTSMPASACAAANAAAPTPSRSVTMYSPGIGSPMARSSIVGTTVVLVVDELVDVVELDVEVVDDSVELVATVVVLGSCVSMTDITESGSTINT